MPKKGDPKKGTRSFCPSPQPLSPMGRGKKGEGGLTIEASRKANAHCLHPAITSAQRECRVSEVPLKRDRADVALDGSTISYRTRRGCAKKEQGDQAGTSRLHRFTEILPTLSGENLNLFGICHLEFVIGNVSWYLWTGAGNNNV